MLKSHFAGRPLLLFPAFQVTLQVIQIAGGHLDVRIDPQGLLIVLHGGLQLLGVLVHSADIVVSPSETRFFIEGQLEITDSLVMPLQETVDQTHVVIFHGPRRRGTHRLFQITHRILIISQAGLHFTQAVGGQVIHGIQIDSLLQGIQRVCIVFEPEMRLAQLGIVSGFAPIVLGQGVQRRDHFFPGTPNLINPYQGLVRLLIRGIQLQRSFSHFDGRAVLPGIGKNHTQITESTHMFGILPHRLLEQLLRSLVIPVLRLLDALVVGGRGVRGYHVIH